MHIHTRLNCLIVTQHPIHTDVLVQGHHCAKHDHRNNSVCLCTPLVGLHWIHSSVPHPQTPSTPPPQLLLFHLLTRLFSDLLIFSWWQDLLMIDDKLYWPLLAIWNHFIWGAAEGIFTSSFLVPSSVFNSTDSSLLRKRHQREPR